ncbi:MAG TPA: BA14K family protein [Rhizobiaceae bacterium]|nr:BA14K family protein [Rhizobiaceae bacterium]
MNRFLKTAVLSAAMAATAIAPLAEANAGGRYRDREVVRSNSDSDAIVAGIFGIAIGAIAAGIIAGSDNDVVDSNPYRHPRPSLDREVFYEEIVEPEAVEYEYAPSFEPWSRDWYRYCARTYDSFDPATGTYVDYDGFERFCR